MKTTRGTKATWAGLVFVLLLPVGAREARACDDERRLEIEVLGMSRGEVVYLVSDLWMLSSVTRFEVGQRTVYVLSVMVPEAFGAGYSWGVDRLLPVAAGARAGPSARGRRTKSPASP